MAGYSAKSVVQKLGIQPGFRIFVDMIRLFATEAAALAVLIWPLAAPAVEMRGVTATEIKIGQTMPYSGPVSAFGALCKGEVGYFKMLNERGGINGRKVNLISLDDSYAPPKTVEQTRRLVESDDVALIFSSIGTAHNTAIAKYLQSKNIPQLFVGSGDQMQFMRFNGKSWERFGELQTGAE
jgi:branched-chain amino acid transport system substrate-binding protein